MHRLQGVPAKRDTMRNGLAAATLCAALMYNADAQGMAHTSRRSSSSHPSCKNNLGTSFRPLKTPCQIPSLGAARHQLLALRLFTAWRRQLQKRWNAPRAKSRFRGGLSNTTSSGLKAWPHDELLQVVDALLLCLGIFNANKTQIQAPVRFRTNPSLCWFEVLYQLTNASICFLGFVASAQASHWFANLALLACLNAARTMPRGGCW